MAQVQHQPMPLRPANNNWHNVPGASQVSWSADNKSKGVNNPFTNPSSQSRSRSEAGIISDPAYSMEPLPVRDRFTSFSGPSTPRSNGSPGHVRDPSPPSRMHRQPSLVDMVKTLPPVVETSTGTRFNAAEFVAHLDGPQNMKERHRKIQAAIDILQSIIKSEEQDYQQQQQRLEQQRLEQQRLEQQRIEQQRQEDLRRFQEQQRLEEQQRMQEQQKLHEQRIVEQQQQQLAQLQQYQQQQQFQQQYQHQLPSWNQSTTPGFERKESNPLLAEIQAEHEYRTFEQEVKKEEDEAERGRSFSIFRSRNKSTSSSPASSRERKPSVWAGEPQSRERQGSDWFSTASENRKGSVANAGMAEFRERKGSDWYSTASERKTSIASEGSRKGSTASNFRKGSTTGMPKTRRPSEWGASAACFA